MSIGASARATSRLDAIMVPAVSWPSMTSSAPVARISDCWLYRMNLLTEVTRSAMRCERVWLAMAAAWRSCQRRRRPGCMPIASMVSALRSLACRNTVASVAARAASSAGTTVCRCPSQASSTCTATNTSAISPSTGWRKNDTATYTGTHGRSKNANTPVPVTNWRTCVRSAKARAGACWPPWRRAASKLASKTPVASSRSRRSPARTSTRLRNHSAHASAPSRNNAISDSASSVSSLWLSITRSYTCIM